MLRKKNRLLVILILVSSALLSADAWFNDYNNAKKAAKKGQWSEVITYINNALEEKKTPHLNAKTVGLRFVDYTPYYFLGQANYRMGKFKEALAFFERSLDDGAVKKTKHFNALQQMLEECRSKLKPAAIPVTPKPQPKPIKPTVSKDQLLIKQYISEGDSLSKEGDLTAAEKEYTKAKSKIEETGECVARLGEVNGKLRDLSAKSRLAKNKESLQKVLHNAEKLQKKGRFDDAERLLQDFRSSEPKNKNIKRLLKRIRQGRELAKKEKQRNEEERKKTLEKERKAKEDTTVSPPANTGTSGITKLISEGEKLYKNNFFEEAKNKFAAVLQLEANHQNASLWLKRIAYSLSIKHLNLGINNYFKGDRAGAEKSLRETLKNLSKLDESKFTKQRVLTWQFMAALLIEKHYLNKKISPALLKEARSFINNIKSVEPNFQLEGTYFSPKIAKFFSAK
ncbi:MAG: hypothetical protein GY757_35620 [bacterium]|nr:hypothetical protein [bacterium]